MVQSQFSLSWDSYKTSICNGFSALQQNGEFVDMTLAADGHFVKVHQVLIALASPYLKELMSSAPCQHPVIFLNQVSHKILTLLLEYIYTGEVMVPAETLSSFIESAKSLHIKGLENLSNNGQAAMKMEINMPGQDNPEFGHVSGIKNFAVPTSAGMGQITLPAAARKVLIRQSLQDSTEGKTPLNSSYSRDDNNMYDSMMDDTGNDDMDDWGGADTSQEASTSKTQQAATDTSGKLQANFQFTVSIRGALQVILNRYLYNLHSTMHRRGIRRWRCVDYRNNRCQAFLVTKGNIVLNRANLHNHSFHDKKILAKIEQKAVYSTIEDIEGYKEKEKDKEVEPGDDLAEFDEVED